MTKSLQSLTITWKNKGNAALQNRKLVTSNISLKHNTETRPHYSSSLLQTDGLHENPNARLLQALYTAA
jgi:hypothetical protein